MTDTATEHAPPSPKVDGPGHWGGLLAAVLLLLLLHFETVLSEGGERNGGPAGDRAVAVGPTEDPALESVFGAGSTRWEGPDAAFRPVDVLPENRR